MLKFFFFSNQERVALLTLVFHTHEMYIGKGGLVIWCCINIQVVYAILILGYMIDWEDFLFFLARHRWFHIQNSKWKYVRVMVIEVSILF